MESMASPESHVSASDLERLLGEAKRSAAGTSAGLFGPDSVSWKINREAGLFLAAGRATLLQLAHPWVAAAIAEHSTTLHDPIGRFHQTFRVMFTISFGSVEQAIAVARHLHSRHQGIRGTMPETVGAFAAGSRYEANEVHALLWVYATLIDSTRRGLRSRTAGAHVRGARAVLRREPHFGDVLWYPAGCLAAELAGSSRSTWNPCMPPIRSP